MIVDIREAELKDIERIVGFQKEMALETENLDLNRDVLLKGVTAALEDRSKATYFIAEQEGELISMLMITKEWSDWRNGWVWWIQSVYTKPGFRRMGIYTLLYEHIKNLVIKSHNTMGLRLYVDKRNIRAQSLYDSLGMTGEHYTTYEWMKE
ncbi:MAG: GNAT family N-acetyltransferase [Bacteroidales bacterium]